MNEALEQLNEAASDAAEARFLDCCGSRRWASEMTAARPFAEATALLKQAEQIWLSLDARDWLEAFAAHPKIGSRRAAPKQQIQSAEWSRGEQASVESAESSVLDALAAANRLYEEKFGYIFIVCATGKSAAEMLDLCRRRLANNPDAEIRIAADEQQKITEIRLRKLLEAV
jgi:2-oxo-4-hydroxy-4-carboxy-5-ureidoimidazoline decarboxylase